MPGGNGSPLYVMEGCGEGREASPGSGRGDLLLKFPPFLSDFDYVILDTDLDSFASVYFCSPMIFGYARWELGWVMTRNSEREESLVSELSQVKCKIVTRNKR